MVRHAVDHPDVTRMFSDEVMRGAPLPRALWDPSRQAVGQAAQVIDGWAQAGLIHRADPVHLQFHRWALTQHSALHQAEVRFMLGLADPAPLDPDTIAAEVTAQVLRGLRP